MPYVSDMEAKGITVMLSRVGIRTLLIALAVAALMAVMLTLGSVGAVSAQNAKSRILALSTPRRTAGWRPPGGGPPKTAIPGF